MLNVAKYRILEKLGEGGMGEVYLAEDPLLGRTVAIKVLSRRGREADHAEARFLREAQTASSCNHPNIASIYELGQTEDASYIVMEYVQGHNLRADVGEQVLPPDSILDIAIQVCSALEAAHNRGVIHRDIKPENILISQSGHVKLVDFGLAKRVPQRQVPGTSTLIENLTQTGVLIGTPAYMSPEQIKGEEPDVGADIFSFGIVLYEMITGKLPFPGESALEIAASILRDRALRIESGSSKTIRQLGAIVDRCLEKDRNNRYATISEVKKHLIEIQKGQAPDPLVLRSQAKSSDKDVTIILVSPFQWIGAPGKSDFIPLVITRALITDLTRIPGVSVLSGPAGKEAMQTARELGAGILLEGEIVEADEKIAVMARLTNVATAQVLWGGQHRSDASDLFAIQDTVCQHVSDALQITLTSEVRTQIARPATSNVDAFHHYAEGKTLMERHDKSENLTSAIHLFEEALNLDPKFALAYAGLGEAYCQKYHKEGDPAYMKRAVEACDNALILDPSQAQVHISLGILYYNTGKIDRALEELLRAVEIQPASDEAHQWIGRCYLFNNDREGAVASFQKAISIRPFWEHYVLLGKCLANFGEYKEAIEQYRQVIFLQPDNYHGYINLGAMYYMLGEYSEAATIFKRAIEIYPSHEAMSNLGAAYFYLEDYANAIEMFLQAVRLNPNDDIYHRNLGDAYQGAGMNEEANNEYAIACRLIEQALRIASTDANLIGRLAICQAKCGLFAEAAANIQRAGELSPQDATILYYRSVALALSGNSKDAAGILQQALEQGYSRAEAERDPDLDSLRKGGLL